MRKSSSSLSRAVAIASLLLATVVFMACRSLRPDIPAELTLPGSWPDIPAGLTLPADCAIESHEVIWAGDGFEGPDQRWVIRSSNDTAGSIRWLREQMSAMGGDLPISESTKAGVTTLSQTGGRIIIAVIRPSKNGSLIVIKEIIALP